MTFSINEYPATYLISGHFSSKMLYEIEDDQMLVSQSKISVKLPASYGRLAME